MSIEATVIPQGIPQVGIEVTAETFERIGTPRVFVPTNNITIQSGETMQVDGTLVINGTLSGGGLTTAITQGLSSLNDVEITNLGIDQVLFWDGSKWRNSGSLNSRLDLIEDYIYPVDSNIDGGRAFVGQTTFLNGGSANIVGNFTTINGGSA